MLNVTHAKFIEKANMTKSYMIPYVVEGSDANICIVKSFARMSEAETISCTLRVKHFVLPS